MKIIKYISIILICLQIFPLNLYAASSKRKSAVIVPIRDGNRDKEAEHAALKLGELLGAREGYKIVDRGNVESVLHYYDRTDDKALVNIEELLRKSKESYYRLNYVEAKSVVNKVLSKIRSLPSAEFDYGNIVLDANLTLGIISKSMGNVGEARQAFKEALRLDPNYKLDSRAFSPSVVNLFENVRSTFDLQPRGTLRVESNPRVANVYLNGILKGVTPITIEEVPEGLQHLKISANKYSTVRKKVNIEAGKKVRVKEKLIWTAGKKGTLNGKKYVSAESALGQVEEGLTIADLLKVDKVIMVDADSGGSAGVLSARMVDAKYRAGHTPIVLKGGPESITKLANQLASQSKINIAHNPEKYSSPVGKGETVLLGKKGRKKISKPLLFGILGGVVAAGLGAGLAAAFAGGGGSGGGSGSVNVTFSD